MDKEIEVTPLSEGNWWRLSAYEIRDGWIRPAAGATVETFDPWGEHRLAWDSSEAIDLRMKRKSSPPYQRLFDLLDGLSAGAFASPTDDDAEAVAGWCREFGLLGLLSHRMVAATFPPRWESDPNIQRVVPATTTWIRKPNGWQASTTPHWVLDGQTISGEQKDVGEVVPPESLPKSLPLVGVHVRKRAGMFDTEFLSVSDSLKNYFPGVPAAERQDFRYPLPLSEPFWIQYGERLSEFLSCATALKRAVTALCAGPFTDETDHEILARALDARDRLVGLSSGVGQFLSFREDGSLTQSWVSTSLISSLAAMALDDLAKARVRRCRARGCGKPFASSSYQATYCSARCRERESKAQYRARKQAKGRPSAERKRNGKETRQR